MYFVLGLIVMLHSNRTRSQKPKKLKSMPLNSPAPNGTLDAAKRPHKHKGLTFWCQGPKDGGNLRGDTTNHVMQEPYVSILLCHTILCHTNIYYATTYHTIYHLRIIPKQGDHRQLHSLKIMDPHCPYSLFGDIGPLFWALRSRTSYTIQKTMPYTISHTILYSLWTSGIPYYIPYHNTYCTILYTVPYYILYHAIYHTILHTIPYYILYHIILHYTILYTIPYYTPYHTMYYTILYTIPYHITLYHTIIYSQWTFWALRPSPHHRGLQPDPGAGPEARLGEGVLELQELLGSSREVTRGSRCYIYTYMYTYI